MAKTAYRDPVDKDRIDAFLSEVYGKNKKSSNRAVKKALQAVLFGVAAGAYASHRRARK